MDIYKLSTLGDSTKQLGDLKLFLVAGEKSGDLHGGNLIKALKAKRSDIEIAAWGGDRMQAEGALLKNHYEKMAFMGLWEVIKNLRTIFQNLKKCKEDILQFGPDAVILIDYAGFNLKIAKFCKQNNIKVFYYISPKVWAWNTDRAWKIKKLVDHLLVIFPFEVDFFRKYDYKVDYVGNPLMDEIEAFKPNVSFRKENNLGEKPIIAILAGSRLQEVKAMLPIMLSIRNQYTDYQFVIAGVSNLPASIYEPFGVKTIYNDTYNLLVNSEAALVTSGTATLETALLGIPQVVCYKTSQLTYQVGMLLIKVKFASLVNLTMEKETVKELIQHEFNEKNLKIELDSILVNGSKRATQLTEYKQLKEKVGNAGASERAAKLIFKYLATDNQN
ncbi:MAG: lipid-A-disaccharide synthase [Bacteroidota bacterium]